MKLYKLHQLQQRRHFTHDRYLVGIDPAKVRHQAQILAPDGLPLGSTFSFAHSFTGFHHQLWQRLAARLPDELALFLAEVRDPTRITHTRQVERLGGLNLYVHDSGTYKGRRRISHIGNSRLRWVLFQMASETTKYVPEIRVKYLRRRLKGQTNRTKNLVAVIPSLLALVMALMRDQRTYQERPEAVERMRRLEAELERTRSSKRSRRSRSRTAA